MRNVTGTKYATPANAKPNTVRHASHVGVSHPLYFAFCLLCLAISVVILGEAAMAWVENNDSVIASSGDIFSSQRGVTGGFENDLTKTQYLIGGNTEAVKQGYIPGDRKYYTFVINVLYSDLLASSGGTLEINVELVMENGTSETKTAETGHDMDFLSHLCVEKDAVEIALLRRTQRLDNLQYDVIPISDKLQMNHSSSFARVDNGAITSFVKNSHPLASTLITLNGANWPSVITNDLIWADSSEQQRVSFMVYIPIWYVDTNVSQDAEKDCYLIISDTVVTINPIAS